MESEGVNHFPKTEIVDDHKFSIDGATYKKVLGKLFEKRLELLLEGEKVKLPLRSGYLELKKYRSGKSIDWLNTNKFYKKHNKENPNDKKYIYHKNYHTQGYKPILIWDKRTSVLKNKSIFRMRFTRSINRFIAKMLKDNPLIINNLNEL